MGHTHAELAAMNALVSIAKSLEKITAHLETIAVSSEALIDDNFTGGDPQ